MYGIETGVLCANFCIKFDANYIVSVLASGHVKSERYELDLRSIRKLESMSVVWLKYNFVLMGIIYFVQYKYRGQYKRKYPNKYINSI